MAGRPKKSDSAKLAETKKLVESLSGLSSAIDPEIAAVVVIWWESQREARVQATKAARVAAKRAKLEAELAKLG